MVTYILTDHNESKQIIDGYKSMNMCGVVDHHRIGDFETDGPVFMRLEPVGCSNTIITKIVHGKQSRNS